MQEPKHTSFDVRGLLFALKLGVVLVVVFAGVKYGTVRASEHIMEAAAASSGAVELQLLETKAKNLMRSFGEINILQKLSEFEATLSTRTIGTASVETLAQAHERMIAADLTEMKLYLFENGQATATYDIQSKGKRGSRWETPTGLYKIESKEYSHFSSIGLVDMPYSMQFFGNFFIHGWPTYPDGTPVPEGFSGGCIRLSTEDAEKVFTFAGHGTPIFIWEGTASTTPIELTDRALPKVSAEAYLIADIHSGVVYAEKNADTQRPIASLSKLLTALVANETIHYDRTFSISAEDRRQTEGTPGSITTNDTFTIGDLFYPLLMESNNSVAFALARYNGEDAFMDWVNEKAHAIGMMHTSLEEPSGISEHNVSTASDIFKLTRYIATNQSYIFNISREQQKTITAEDGSKYTIANFNHFAGNPEFIGGKTGYTVAAGETMTTVFEIPIGLPAQAGKSKATIAIIVLGSKDRKADVERLLTWFKAASAE